MRVNQMGFGNYTKTLFGKKKLCDWTGGPDRRMPTKAFPPLGGRSDLICKCN